MKIQFGTTLTMCHIWRAVALGFAILVIISFNLYLQNVLAESEKSILHSRGLNVTRISPFLYCDLPYDECLCSILSNKSDTSEKCVTKIQLVGSRILPFISFFLQICLIRELFSLSEDHPRFIIYALWIISIFIFVGMKICINWSACYHVYITAALYSTGGPLWFLSLLNLLINEDRIGSTSDQNQVIVPHRTETAHNESRAWIELL